MPQEGEKKMKKSCRWMALLLSGLMVLSACSKSEETTKKKKKTKKTTTAEETETDETDEPSDSTEDDPVPTTTQKDTEPDTSTTLASLTTPDVGSTTRGLPDTSSDPQGTTSVPVGVSAKSQKIREVLTAHGFVIFDDQDDWCNETFGAYVEANDGTGLAFLFDDYIDQEDAKDYFDESVEEAQEAKQTGELSGTVDVKGNRLTIRGIEKGNEDEGELYGVMILDGNVVVAISAFGATDELVALADEVLKECGY